VAPGQAIIALQELAGVRAVVVGGGIIGLFTAFHLKQEGAGVVIIERSTAGEWSRAAAGILEFTRYKINVINTGSYALRYLRMMLRGEARVKTLDLKWLAAYLKALNSKPPGGAWEALRELGELSRRQYRALAEERNDFEYSEEPLCEIGVDVSKELEEARRDPLSPRVEAGRCCGADALLYLDAAKLSTEALIDRMLRELRGVELVRGAAESVTAGGVRLEGGRVIKADAVVVAAGYWARELGVPVAPFKGYGFRVTARAKCMLVDASRGVAAVPLSGWTKVTGRFDLDGSQDHSPSQMVLKLARRLLGTFEVIDMAVGYRPCTPDGLPVVDVIGGTVVVTGACRLGWTYAPALGRLAADLALGRRRPGGPLSAERFAARGRR
jgi:D-proline dehydrogenase